MSVIKKIIFFISLFCCISVNAQNSISAYGFLSISNTKAMASNTDFDRNKARSSTSWGVNYRHEMKSEGFAFSVGIEWLDTGSEYTALTFGNQIFSDNGIGISQLDKWRLMHRIKYISLPLLYSYCKSTKNDKWNFSTSAGGSPDIFIHHLTDFTFTNEDGEKRSRVKQYRKNYNFMILSLRGEFGVEGNISNNLAAFTNLSYRWGVTKNARHEDFRSLNYGVKFGVRYHFE